MAATVPVYRAVAPPDAFILAETSGELDRHASMAALSDMAPHPLLTFLCFLSTLVVFPGIASEFVAALLPRSWVSLLMLMAFNTGDLVGRSLAGAERVSAPLLKVAATNLSITSQHF